MTLTHNSLVPLFSDIADAIRAKTGGGETVVSQTPASYTAGDNVHGTNYQAAVGKGSDTANTTGNDYFETEQGGSGSTWIEYSFDFSGISNNTIVKSVSVKVKGHCEDPSQERQIATVQLYSGSTAKGDSLEITSSTDAVYELTPGSWTVAELQQAKLRFTIGVYGGRISGVTWEVTVVDALVADDFPSAIEAIITGLEYETGTYTPNNNIAKPTIQWANTHSEAPFFVMIVDAQNTANTTSNRMKSWSFINYYKLFGCAYTSESTFYDATWVYANVEAISMGSSGLTVTTFQCTHSSGNTNTTYPEYWVGNLAFSPNANSNSIYWSSGRAYKWIAVWKPAT